MSKMELVIQNCNNINNGQITLEQGALNIKYGINGTGKSTIARAIELSCSDSDNLRELIPFKSMAREDGLKPTLQGLPKNSSALVFNEKYIKQFAFKQNELLENSFEIFVKPDGYEQRTEEIQILVSSIGEVFKNDERLEKVISDLDELSKCFGASKEKIHKSSPVGKALASGNNVANIPANLKQYSSFIQSDQNVSWIQWQIKGNEFIDISDNCPFCVAPADSNRKSEIRQVSESYDAKAIQHLERVIKVIDSLKQYFAPKTLKKLKELTINKTQMTELGDNYLVEIKKQIEALKVCFENLRGITFYTFNDVNKVSEKIASLKIDLNLVSHLNSDETKQIVSLLNESLNTVLKKTSDLQALVNIQKKRIRDTIESNKLEINNFLELAGYKYNVEVEGEGELSKLVLVHVDIGTQVERGDQHLSYGERNAFSLVLFMHECLVKNPTIIVLDDPISSFDANKKFAIIETLFRGKRSLKGKTVLFLTHDIEPIVDMIKTLRSKFSSPLPNANFLKSKRGILTETTISNTDLITFAEICSENISNISDLLLKTIYLRRDLEVRGDKGDAYQLLSSLFKGKQIPTVKNGVDHIPMSSIKITEVENNIKAMGIQNFEYATLVKRVNDPKELKKAYMECESGYEKLQIFRLTRLDTDNALLSKIMKQTYHIENEYISQLNPSKYEMIPEFIIEKVDDHMNFEHSS